MIELSPHEWAEQWLTTLISDRATDELREKLKSIRVEFHPNAQHDLLKLRAPLPVPGRMLRGPSLKRDV